jgi:hypothetical protein
VFLPFVPVTFLVLLDIAYKVLSYFRLYSLAGIVDAITIFVTVVPLALYWAVAIRLCDVGTSTPYSMQLVELVAVAALFSACLFVSDIVFTIVFRRGRRYDHI